MISLQVYRLIHFLGILLLFIGLGGILISHFSGATLKKGAKIMAMASHGVGLFLIILGGFGMLARLGITDGLPGWIYAKLAIWVYFGAAIVLVKKRAGWMAWAALLVVGMAAPFLAIYKPF